MASAGELYAVIRLVRPLFKHLLRSVENALDGSGVTVAMRGILELLDEAGPLTVPDIARRLMIQRQFVQLAVDTLRRQGLVERAANPAHRRSALIRQTEVGRTAFAAIKARETAVIEAVARDLDAADLARCHTILTHMTRAFAKVAAAPEEPA